MSGWPIVPLFEVLDSIGNGINRSEARGKGSGEYKITRIETITSGLIDASKTGLGDLDDKEVERYRLQPGDILFSHINSVVHVGKTALYVEDIGLIHGINLLRLRPSSSISPSFLQYFLRHLFRSRYWVGVAKQAINQASVNQKDLAKVLVPLPPLDEQKRIVAKLDAAQQEFDRLNNNLEQQLSQLTDFDRALLSEMLESPYQTPEPAVTNRWPYVVLGDVAEIQGGYAFKSSEYSNSGHYLIRIANVIDNQVIRTDDKYVDLESDPRMKRFELEVGDLLVTLTGNIGRTAIVNKSVLPAALNQRVARIHADRKMTSNKFLQYLFNSCAFIQHIHGAGHGAAQQNVSTKDLETFRFPLPPLDEQKRIVAKLDEASSTASLIRDNIADRKKSASELQSSILAAAFAGSL